MWLAIKQSTFDMSFSEISNNLPVVLVSVTTNGEYERSVLGDKINVVLCPGDMKTFTEWERVIAMIISHQPQMTKSTIERCPQLRLIARLGIGVDNVDIKAATDLGVCVCNVPNYGIEEVADTTFAHILALFRQTATLQSSLLSGTTFSAFEVTEVAKSSRRIRNKTLGLIGMGNIGMAVCMRAKAFGFNIMVYDPFLNVGIDKAVGGLTRVSTVEELVCNSDCVSLHCPLLPNTRNIINEERLKLFKKDAFLVNTARGGLVDEKALVKALKDGCLAGAALDVQENEPLSYKGSLFEGVKNIILTPHGGWYSKESFDDVYRGCIEAVKHSLNSTEPAGLKHLLNKDVVKKTECKTRWNNRL